MALPQGVKAEWRVMDGSNRCVYVCETHHVTCDFMFTVSETDLLHWFCDVFEVLLCSCVCTLVWDTVSCKCCVMWLCNMRLQAGGPHWSMKWSVIGKCAI